MRQQQASATAKVIAAAMVLLDSHEETRHLVARGAASWCEVFLSASRSGRFLAASVKCSITRGLWLALERCTLPGIIRHYARRKCWIEAQCRASIADGYGQLVIIGAGFDTLGLRMAQEFPQLHVIEIDHPATQAEKLRGMAMSGNAWPENMRFVAVDLEAGDIPSSLFPAREATAFVMEGLLMYLAEERVNALLANLRALPVERSRMIVSYMSRRADGRAGFTPHSRVIDLWLRLRNEPFRWSRTQEQMTEWMESAGFSCLSHATGPEMAGPDSSNRALEGENYLLAERGVPHADQLGIAGSTSRRETPSLHMTM
jgi:methyltransferase (TIGR00027 family)